MTSAARVALITGVSGGIGAATAAVFSQNGWTTIGMDRRPPAPGTVDQFEPIDLADAAAISAALVHIATIHSGLDALVNNAAHQVCKPLGQTSIDEWDRVMAVNVRAPFWLVHEALDLLEARGGAVVNVASVHAVATSRDIAAYAASKGAITALTRAAALELATKGIRVNAVLPGAVDTEMLRAGFSRDHVGAGDPEEQLAQFGALHPMGRVATPSEIAEAILYLADSARSSYVTGSSLVVDGGVTARLSTE